MPGGCSVDARWMLGGCSVDARWVVDAQWMLGGWWMLGARCAEQRILKEGSTRRPVTASRMFSGFFTAVHVAYTASQITARHAQPKGPPLAYHHPLEQVLFDALSGSSSGAFVHWGVYESGKSTAVREAAGRLQEEAGRQVIVVQGYDFTWRKPVAAWLRRGIGIPEDMREPLSSLFAKPGTTLVIDHADLLMRVDRGWDKNRDVEFLELVQALIHESEQTKRFNVLLVVNSWERAKELVGAGCRLAPGDAPARWTRDQLETLLATLPDDVRSRVGERKDELLRLATLSGTPGYLNFEAYSNSKRGYDARHAAMHDLEWHRGIRGLHTPLLELPEWCRAETTEGRFPDKNCVYHHEDLASLRPAGAGMVVG